MVRMPACHAGDGGSIPLGAATLPWRRSKMDPKCHQISRRKSRQKVAAIDLRHATIWGISSSGRASALQAEGDGFESRILHHSQLNNWVMWPTSAAAGAKKHKPALICPNGGMADALDSKSSVLGACGFKSRFGHQSSWWNRQTCSTQNAMPKGVWVQVPPWIPGFTPSYEHIGLATFPFYMNKR